MVKQLEPEPSGTEEVCRILRKQVSRAAQALEPQAEALSDEAVHRARKQIKKARALLRLLRPALSTRRFRKENEAFRAAARPLTGVRDAKVLVDTLNKLAKHYRDRIKGWSLAEVRRGLQEYQHETSLEVRGDDTLAPLRKKLETVRKRARKWPIGRHGWSVLGPGFERVYRAGRNAFRTACTDPTVENLHEWRKQTKYLWHQLELLEPLWPPLLEQVVAQLHALADHLGDDHDLAILRDKLEDGRFQDRAVVARLQDLIDQRRQELEQIAFVLGRRLFAEKPRRLRSRLRTYWRAWRSESAGCPSPADLAKSC